MAPSPHDILVKKTFSIVENAEGELRSILPKELSHAIDWSTLRLEPGSFVDDEQRELRSDLLFSAQTAEGGAYFYMLFEHQSTVDRTMPLRMLGYMVRIWTSQLENGTERLVPIVPIVLHHSASGWTASRDLVSLLDVPPRLREATQRFVPNFEMVIDDLARTSELELLERPMTSFAKLVVWVLRAIRVSFAPELVGRWAAEASRAATVAPREALRALFGYLGEVQGGATLLEALLTAGADQNVEDVAMGLRHEWEALARAEGEARGRAEGEARGRAELLRKQLRLKFGELPEGIELRVREGTIEELERWAERVLTEGRLDSVFS